MSKSLGNMYTLSDLKDRGFTPGEVRYVLVSGYYRRPLNFLLDSLSDAKAALQRLLKFHLTLSELSGEEAPSYETLRSGGVPDLGVFAEAWESLQDDLNTPEALGHVFSGWRQLNSAELTKSEASKALYAFHFILAALGIMLPDPKEKTDIPEEVLSLAKERWEAKASKNWAKSDELRDRIIELGWEVKDGKDDYELSPL